VFLTDTLYFICTEKHIGMTNVKFTAVSFRLILTLGLSFQGRPHLPRRLLPHRIYTQPTHDVRTMPSQGIRPSTRDLWATSHAIKILWSAVTVTFSRLCLFNTAAANTWSNSLLPVAEDLKSSEVLRRADCKQ